jgi:hypothetical protein
MDGNVKNIVADVWKELQEASRVEAPLNIKPFYDDMVKREGPTTKVLVLTSRSLLKLIWMNSSLFQQSTIGVLR